ncbi:MAG: thioesterase family protein [Gordonia sp. (in: high G+C Gram-positive bacteria)]
MPEQSAVSDTSSTEVVIGLRWGDMDSNGHINNVQFARLFEESRVRALGEWFSHPPKRLSVLVASQTIEFRAVLEYTPEPVRVTVGVSRIGRSSFTTSATLVAAHGVTCAVAQTTLVAVDDSGRPVPIIDADRAVLEARRIAPIALHGSR